MIKRLGFIRQKEDELSHKLMYVKVKLQECKQQHRPFKECMEEAKAVGLRSIENYIEDI